LLDARISQGFILAQRREHRTHLALPETQATQSGEELCLDLQPLRLGHMTVCAAIAMAKSNPAGRVLFDQERSTMDRSVMSTTEGKDILRDIATTLGPQLDVVQIEEGRVLAARDTATVPIAHQYGPA
jgi:hypothetical protein